MLELRLYDYINIISNAFNTFVIFKFMCIFFDRSNVNRKIETISYLGYFMIISLIYLLLNIPIITLLCNIIVLFMLSFNYKSALKKRAIAIILIYTIMMVIESIGFVLVKVLSTNIFMNFSSKNFVLVNRVTANIISYIVVLIVGTLKNIKSGFNIPNSNWLAIFFIPLGTLFITYSIISASNDLNNDILVSVIILFSINVLVFYLYDALSNLYEEEMEAGLLRQQNNYYLKQFEIMEKSQENVRMLRHDMKNHIMALQFFVKNDNKEKALEYINSFNNYLEYTGEYVKSGNINVDSVLNYKIQEAEDEDIDVDVKLKIPAKMSISPFDINIILGNLLDNAIEATSKLESNKKIKINLDFDRNVLYIAISNTFDGKVIYEDNKIQTRHKDKYNHGIGLNNVQRIVDKYDGEMEINHTDDVFYVYILMYNL